MDRLRELELEVTAAEIERDTADEEYDIISREYHNIKRRYDDLYDWKKEKEDKLFEARKTLFYYKEGLGSK